MKKYSEFRSDPGRIRIHSGPSIRRGNITHFIFHDKTPGFRICIKLKRIHTTEGRKQRFSKNNMLFSSGKRWSPRTLLQPSRSSTCARRTSVRSFRPSSRPRRTPTKQIGVGRGVSGVQCRAGCSGRALQEVVLQHAEYGKGTC